MRLEVILLTTKEEKKDEEKSEKDEAQPEAPRLFVNSNTGSRTSRLDGKKDKDGNWGSHDEIVSRCKAMGYDNLDECPFTKEIEEATGKPWLKAIGYDDKKQKSNRKASAKRRAKRAKSTPTADEDGDAPEEVVDDEEQKVMEEQADMAMSEPEEAQEEATPAKPDYDSMSAKELREEAGKRGIPKSGTKAQLVRLLKEDDEKADTVTMRNKKGESKSEAMARGKAKHPDRKVEFEDPDTPPPAAPEDDQS